MRRHQTGYIFESAPGAFHVRYYTTEIIEGQPKRGQKSRLLCHKDSKLARAFSYSDRCRY